MVLLNTGASPVNVGVDAGGFASARSATYLTTFHPGASQVWKDVGQNVGSPGAGNSLTMPPRSVATLVLWHSALVP